VGVGSIALANSGNILEVAGWAEMTLLTVTPADGFQGQVDFTCSISGAPTGVSCYVPPTYVTSAAAASVDLVVNSSSSSPLGSYSILVTASDDATGKITASTTLNLTVTGPPALSMTNSGNITVHPGASTGNTSTIAVTPVNGFAGVVNLSCSLNNMPTGVSDLPICKIQSPITITGPTAATATFSVLTTAPAAASLDYPRGRSLLAQGGSILALVIFLGVPARRRGWRALLSLVMMMLITSAILACGGGGGSSGGGGGSPADPGTPLGSYNFTVKAVDAATGQISASSVVTVTVN
jgi:hypothetical protein